MLPVLRKVLTDLLNEIESTGELNNYWNAVQQKNAEKRTLARRKERSRQRIQQGSEYETSEGELEDIQNERRKQIEKYRRWDEEADGSSHEVEESENEFGFDTDDVDEVAGVPEKKKAFKKA